MPILVVSHDSCSEKCPLSPLQLLNRVGGASKVRETLGGLAQAQPALHHFPSQGQMGWDGRRKIGGEEGPEHPCSQA